jgi:hypothetical protein
MPIPSKTKTWQFNVNNARGGSGSRNTDDQLVLFFYKTAITTFASYGWTCSGSSNSIASGMDGVDRWVSSANLIWATAPTAHSWIVLRQTGISSHFEVCFDLSYLDYTTMNIVVSTIGFGAANGGTDGSINNRPTATDEYSVYTYLAHWIDSNVSGTQSYKCHCMQSNDGQCTRFYACNIATGKVVTLICFEKPQYPISGWSDPWFSMVKGSADRTLSSAKLTYWNDNAIVKFRQGGINTQAYLSSIFCISSCLAEQAAGGVVNSLTGEWPFYGTKLYSEGPAMNRGKVGVPFDLYYGPLTLTNGDQFDASPSRMWSFINDLIIPWNGTVMQVT